MSTERDRAWVAGRLNREDVPQFVWEVLETRFYKSGRLRSEVTMEKLATWARALLDYGDVVESVTALAERNEETDERIASLTQPQISDYELGRSRALAEYLALWIMGQGDRLLHTLYHWDGLPAMDELLRIEPERWRELVDSDVEADKLLSRLAQLGERLSKECLGYWSSSEILRSVSSGEFEPRPPIEVDVDAPVNDHLSYGTVTLKVEPWVAPETLTSFYRHYQKAILGYRPKALSLRNLAVARFVFEQLRRSWTEEIELLVTEGMEQPPSGVSWATLMEEWNENYPEETYEEQRLFRRDFNRTARAVVRPYGNEDDVRTGTRRQKQ